MNDLTNPALDLGHLAEEINAEHAAAEETLRAGLGHAKRAGELLLQAKDLVPHGGWLPWMKDHCAFSGRTAQNYMRVAREWDAIQAKTQRVADLSYRDGLKLLTHTKEEDPPRQIDGGEVATKPRPIHEWPLEARRSTCEQWWDILAMYTLAFDAQGWQPDRIANFLGMPARDIELILNPRPPVRFDTELNGARLLRDHRHQRLYQQFYTDTITEILTGWTWTTCGKAQGIAEREGWPDVASEMGARSRAAGRQRERLEGKILLSQESPWADDVLLGHAGWCCALTDARIAAGIEPVQEDGRLLLLMGRYKDVCLEQGWS